MVTENNPIIVRIKGDVNPKTDHPDSACGRAFQDASDECKYHQGYLLAREKNAKWSCCGELGENAPPCVSTAHKNAEWPEEEAKLYFFTKEVTVRFFLSCLYFCFNAKYLLLLESWNPPWKRKPKQILKEGNLFRIFQES